MLNLLKAILFALLASGCATKLPPVNTGRVFDFPRDIFAFPNETVWRYDNGQRVTTPTANGAKVERYTRRCFVMAAGVIQFWKFARFEPDMPGVAPQELAKRIRRVRDIASWEAPFPPGKRVIFPGYTSVWDLSNRDGKLVRANLGPGWTTYFHFRKQAMPFVPSPSHQQQLHHQIDLWLARDQPMVLWLYNFPHVNINHAVTVFAKEPQLSPDFCTYLVYDPNLIDTPHRLVYNVNNRVFSYEKTFYFAGGPVSVRPMYLSLLH
jgi:hypothetical protein